MAIRTVLTYEDYAALPADGRLYEIHEGQLSVTSSPGTRHQEVKANLFDLLRHHVKERGLGKLFDAPTGCILAETTIVQPDIVFVESGRLAIISERGIEGIHESRDRGAVAVHRPDGSRLEGATLRAPHGPLLLDRGPSGSDHRCLHAGRKRLPARRPAREE